MTHTLEKRWPPVAQRVANQSRYIREALQNGEELYRELMDIWSRHDDDAQSVAVQLFDVQAPADAEPLPSTDQVAMVQDLRAALEAFHALHESMDAGALRQLT